MEICFVCTDNASRSPMAEVIARYQIEQLGVAWPVYSAGTEAVDGAPVSSQAEAVCAESGLSLSGKTSQGLKTELITRDTIFVAMENEHRDRLIEQFGVTEDRIFVLQDGIVNPRYGDLHTYRRCRNEVVTEVGDILRFLRSVKEERARLYFVRHAESDFTVREDAIRPLTPRGRQDALKVTAALKDKDITKIYSSPYTRAMDTVSDLAETLDLDVVKVDDLRERAVGGWVEDFPTYTQSQWADFSYKNAGGESLAEVQERNVEAVRTIIGENLGSNVVIGTHGTVLSTIMNYFNPDFGYYEFYRIIDRMPYILCLTVDRTKLISVTEIELNEKQRIGLACPTVQHSTTSVIIGNSVRGLFLELATKQDG